MTHITAAATRTRRITVAALVSALIVGGVFMALSAGAAAAIDANVGNNTAVQNSHATDISVLGSCGENFGPSIRGAKAHWTLSCANGRITMKGWVEDTRSDGKCAQVRGEFSDGTYDSEKSCPAGREHRKSFEWSGPGQIANGYLYIS